MNRGAMRLEIFEARRYDLASKSDRQMMATAINEAFAVTTTAERERCALIAENYPIVAPSSEFVVQTTMEVAAESIATDIRNQSHEPQ